MHLLTSLGILIHPLYLPCIIITMLETRGNAEMARYVNLSGSFDSCSAKCGTPLPAEYFSEEHVTRAATPDEELLIRHSEYHRPRDSKIAAAIKSADARIPSEITDNSGAKKMTLAELAKLGTASADDKNEDKPAPSITPMVAHNVTVEVSSADENTSDPLVRHSEFYKASKSPHAIRRKSDDSQMLLTSSSQERRPTLVDMLEQNKDDNDNEQGNNLMIHRDFMESSESIYSADGMYSNNSVSGEILFGYHYVSGTFTIKILEARDLTPIDKSKNTSDPYVKVYLLPDQSRAGKRKTRVKYGTLDPEFNEDIMYKIATRDLVTRTLWISLWNYDRFGRNEFLGEVRKPLGDYKGMEEHPNWHTLQEMLSDPVSDVQGELVVALMYSQDEKKKKKADSGKLHVKIVEAKNLAGMDSSNLSDPFCKSYLLPDPAKKTKKKTPVMKRNLNPHWNYKFTYDNLTLEELQCRVLELTVWDHDLGSSNDFLGGVRIGLGTSEEPWDDSEGEEVTLWQFLLSKPNTWTQSSLPLRNQMGSRKGLRI